MGVTKHAYRIIEKRGSTLHGLMDGGWATQREAREAANKMAEQAARDQHYPVRTYKVVAAIDLRDTIVKMKAATVRKYLADRHFNCAVDFDDAVPRLQKIARNIDTFTQRNKLTGTRKGWLASKAGIAHLYAVVQANAELRRIQYGNYTQDETDRMNEGGRYNPYSETRTAITEEAKAAVEQAYTDLASASIHSDEW